MNRYPWSILGIEPTDDKREIKKAYARLLKTIDQKQDPQAFQNLREAYDQALQFSEYANHSTPDVNTEKFADKTADCPISDNADTESTGSEDIGEEDREEKDIPVSPQSKTERYLSRIHKTLTEQGEQAAILELQSILDSDGLEALDARYEFEGALLLIVNNLDSIPIAFAHHLIKAFSWQPYDNPFRYDGRFNYAYNSFMSYVQRYEAQEKIKNNYVLSSLVGIDTVGEIIFSPFDEEALNRIAESPPLRQTAQRLLKYAWHQRYPDHVNPVDHRTFDWWDKNVEELYEPPITPQSGRSTRFRHPFLTYIFVIFIMLQGLRTCTEFAKDNFHTYQPTGSNFNPTYSRPFEYNPRIDPRLQKTYPGSNTSVLPTDSLGYRMEIRPTTKQEAQAGLAGAKTNTVDQPKSVNKPVSSTANHKTQPKIHSKAVSNEKILDPTQIPAKDKIANKSEHVPMQKLNDPENPASLNYKPRFKDQDEEERSRPVDYMKPNSDWLRLK